MQIKSFASELKSIWLAPDDKVARERTNALMAKYEYRYPEAIKCLEEGIEDSLVIYSYPELNKRKISSSNMIERLNREIRRHTSVVGIFPKKILVSPSGDRLSDGIPKGLINLQSVYQRRVDISLVTKGSRLIILA